MKNSLFNNKNTIQKNILLLLITLFIFTVCQAEIDDDGAADFIGKWVGSNSENRITIRSI